MPVRMVSRARHEILRSSIAPVAVKRVPLGMENCVAAAAGRSSPVMPLNRTPPIKRKLSLSVHILTFLEQISLSALPDA